jgi:hypothetical protein
MHPPLPRSASATAPSQEALAMLARWLPQGPVSGGSPVAAIAEEEVRRMSGMVLLGGNRFSEWWLFLGMRLWIITLDASCLCLAP